MISELLLIALSLALLFFGAEGLVRGASSIALRAGLNPLIVGLTVVAFGTSTPELVVSVKASLAGQGDIAVGNVIGSNSFNIGIILGLTALICPTPVHRQIIRIDGPLALGIAILAMVLLLDDRIGRLEAAALFVGICAYTMFNFKLARKDAMAAAPASTPAADPATGKRHWGFDLLLIAVGLIVLVIGSRLLVANAISLAKGFGISEAIIGLTIVAAGTSMPELATSVVAAFRRQPEIAVGNVVGSNVFNILGILGVAGLVSPIHAPAISPFDYGTMIVFTLLLLPLLYTGKILHRSEGALLLLLYGGYLFLLWPK